MLLLDIGNTNVKYFDGKNTKRISLDSYTFPDEEFYYINVNPTLEDSLLNLTQSRNVSKMFRFSTHYKGIGIDRVAACYSVDDGVVVDAGSAVTVDLMECGKHQGGFIMPGFSAYKDSFANISSKLMYDLEKEITLDSLPLNTADALLYATLKSIVLMIKDCAKDMPIYITGGDGKRLCNYLPKAVYDENLVFKGMQKAIDEREKIC